MMMIISPSKMRTPQFIFITYVLVSFILIMIFKFIFPGSIEPLVIYSFDWRLIQGLLGFFNLFPALALSALVIPFGLVSYEDSYQSFSDLFFKRLVASVITAIGAAIIYAIIFFLLLPMAKNYEENMRYSGELYKLARENAQRSINAGDWYDASQFLAICDHIWHKNKDLEKLNIEVAINLERQMAEESRERYEARAALIRDRRSLEIWPFSEYERPLNATSAIVMSRTAFLQERYFDAHWLANLAVRLAVRDSPEANLAARVASEAWNMIESQAPNQMERRLYELYHLKLSGYIAMESGDWIRAYYIFQNLLAYTPDDPDAINYYAASEQGARETAFFIDEMEYALGEISTGAIFSLPDEEGRVVLRFSSLTTTKDIAYGMGFEYMKFDKNMYPQAIVSSRYAKLIPIVLDNRQKIIVLTYALDRYNEENNFQSEWILGTPGPGGILLETSFDDLMLIKNVRRGLDNLQMSELFTAYQNLGNSGYFPQIFQAEILNRLGSVMFFLPLAIVVIIVAWRYRAKTRPRYFFVLLLPVLPIVLNGFVFLYRSVLNTMGIWLVLSVGFSAAIVIYVVALAVSLFASLIVLSAQHS